MSAVASLRTLTATLDLASGTVHGTFDVLREYVDGSGSTCVDLGKNGRLACCGYVTHLVANTAKRVDRFSSLSPSVASRESRPVPQIKSDPVAVQPVPAVEDAASPSDQPVIPTRLGRVLIIDLMNVLVARWHIGEKSRIHAVRSTLDTVRQIAADTHPDVIVFAAEGGHGFRQQRFAGYKATRPQTDPGLTEQVQLFHRACEIIGWPVLSSPGLEADDVIATLATDLSVRAESTMIVTSDKDCLQLLTLPGISIYDPAKKMFVATPAVQERLGVRPSQVRDYLAICGDTSDNVPGCKGIGAKGASALLEFGSLEEILQASGRCDVIENSADAVSNHWRPALKSLRNIDADRANVELSRDLVTLVTTAPLPQRWELWPASRPRPGWQLKLQELGLGEPARRLAEPRKKGEQPVLGADRDWHESLIPVDTPTGSLPRANEVTDATSRTTPEAPKPLATATRDEGQPHDANAAIRLLSREQVADVIERRKRPGAWPAMRAADPWLFPSLEYSLAWWAREDDPGRTVYRDDQSPVTWDTATDSDLSRQFPIDHVVSQARIAGARHLPPPNRGQPFADIEPSHSCFVATPATPSDVARKPLKTLF